MSNKCEAIVWERKFGSMTRKLIAVRLADHADDEGRGIWPSIERIAVQCDVSSRTVKRTLHELQEEGILVLVKRGGDGPRDTSRYDLDMAKVEALPLALYGEKRRISDAEQGENKGDTVSPLAENKGDRESPLDEIRVTLTTAKGDSVSNKGDTVSPKPSENYKINHQLRESARETDLEEDQIEGDALSLKKRTDMFTRILQGWFPASGSPKEAQAVWEHLSDADCMAAADKFERWKAEWVGSGHKYKVALSTFLRDRRWTEVPDGPAEPAKSHHNAKPFGKLWNVWRLRVLLRGPSSRMSAPSSYIQGLIDKGGAEGRRWRLRHLALNGYPDVNTMLAEATERRGHAVPVGFEPLAERCCQCSTQSDLFAAWQAEHEKRGWPLIEAKGVEWIWLPVPAQPDDYTEPAAFVAAALEELETALKALGEEGHHNDERAA